MRQVNKAKFFGWAAAAFVGVGLIAYLGVAIYQYFFGMQKQDMQDTAPVLAAEEYNIMYKGEYNGKAILVDDCIYLDMNVVNQEWGHEMLFHAEDVDKVLYTTYTEQTEYKVDGEDIKSYNEELYIRAEEAHDLFGMQYAINEKEKIVALQQPGGMLGEVSKSQSYLLVSPSEEERGYTKELKRGEVISLFETEIEVEGYYYAMSKDGYVGYIPMDRVEKSKEIVNHKAPAEMEVSTQRYPYFPISIAWQQIYTNDFTAEVYDEIYNTAYYVDVVSPTWFKLNSRGGIDSLANEEYVTWTNYRNKQIWALFDNQFDDEVTYNALSDTENRKELCEKLLKLCEKYKLDGINVDFENMSEETERYFIQFMRELAITLRSKGYILSVDVPVPSEWTDYYQRDVLYQLCDFVIVMAYDEHYDGSEVAGSVSSKRFVIDAIYNMMQEGVAADKLILGVPFYTRVWMGVEDLRSEAVSSSRGWGCVYDYGLEVKYDEQTGQNYAEGMVGETLYRIWLEDGTSMKWRLQLVNDNDLAGVAAWSLGYDNYELWLEYEEAFFS